MKNKTTYKRRLDMSVSAQREEFLALLVFHWMTKMSHNWLKMAKKLWCLERYRKIIKQNQQNEAHMKMFGNVLTAETEEDLEKKEAIEKKEKNQDDVLIQKEVVFEDIVDEEESNLEDWEGTEEEEGLENDLEESKEKPKKRVNRIEDYIVKIIDAYYDLLENMKNNLEVNVLTKAEAEMCFEQAVEKFLREHKNHPSNKKVIDGARKIIFN